MSEEAYSEDSLPDLLPLYYNRLFPQQLFHRWLCYGEPKLFNRREISFTLHGDIYLRYQTFETLEDFGQALSKRFPIKIDIGAIYKEPLYAHSRVKTPLEREIVFDIDLTDYDEVRTCCSGADVCGKCWKFMIIACDIIDQALREDFNYQHILWVFSGRRGIHCWVCDKEARKMDDFVRPAIAEYLTLIRGGINVRKVKLSTHIHHSLQRALKIIDQHFEQLVLVDQDILGTNERVTQFLNNIDENLRGHFKDELLNCNGGSINRWNIFQKTFQKLLRDQKIPKNLNHMIEEIKLYYAYPRLDVNVTKSMNHLLKAPFCVHPKTGKVSVPFKAKFAESFDPKQVPTISQLIQEVNDYDAKTKELDKNEHSVGKTVQIKDYKKTTLLKYVTIFNEFLRALQAASIRERSIQSSSTYHFFCFYIFFCFVLGTPMF